MGGEWYKGREKLIEYNGQSKTLAEWSKELGIRASTLYLRLYKLGWDKERAFTEPSRVAEDLTGRRFGWWTVQGKAPKKKTRHLYYYCKCDCGTVSIVPSYSLRDGKSTSCGCRSIIHGHTRKGDGESWASPEYKSWDNMMKRCYNKKAKGYKNYGGRGISVCERWHDFRNFYADMGPRPEGCTLDRLNTNESYGPENCRWATRREQDRNRRDNKVIEANGSRMIISDWATMLGVSIDWINRRLAKGYAMEEVIAFARYK